MPDENTLQEVRRFISDHIASVAQLELLLLLRTAADRSWSVDALSRELRVESSWAEAQLIHLCEHGLVTRNRDAVDERRGAGHFQYQPHSDELRDTVTSVAQAYLLHRVSVIEFIYSKPPQSIRAFADAFKLRGNRRESRDG